MLEIIRNLQNARDKELKGNKAIHFEAVLATG